VDGLLPSIGARSACPAFVELSLLGEVCAALDDLRQAMPAFRRAM
jgi:hypothetical protein